METNEEIEVFSLLQDIEKSIKKVKKKLLQGRRKIPNYPEIYELRNQGLTLKEVGEKFGVSASIIPHMVLIAIKPR